METIELLRELGMRSQRIKLAAEKINQGIIELCAELAQVEIKRAPEQDLSVLTERQREIFKMIALDVTPAEIAKRLGLSVRTVDAHRNTIRVRLKFATADELKEFAKKSLG